MSKIQVDTIDTRSGTSTLTLGSTNASTVALGSGDVQSNFLYPAFFAYRASSTQSATSDTATKVQFNGEIFDTDNTFDSSTNYRFTPGVTGKYHLSSHVRCTSDTQQKGINAQMGIYKNGSVFIQSKPFDFYTAGYAGLVSSWGCEIDCILESDTDDYFEVYVTYNTSSGNLTFLNSGTTDIRTWFQGYRIGT